MTDNVRIGNASGFYGDRFDAVNEMLTGGDLDFLTGDYLAELTMLILAMDRLKDSSRGYAKTFLRQMEQSLSVAVENGVKIVVNAGGLNPAGLAQELRTLAKRLGIDTTIGHVVGDDLVARAGELDLGQPIAANAYLGAWGIAELIATDNHVVVTGRVTDASLVVGPAAAHFGWARDDFDRLAGAMVAGHVIECGTQATGGNYSFFTEIENLGHLGFPIAEIHSDGSSVITKHPGTGGAVTTETVTAQLLYEIGAPQYLGPDAIALFDTISLESDGPDRVRISSVKGEAPPSTLKVGLNSLGGYRNEVVFVLTGLEIDAKAKLVREQLETATGATFEWTLARTDQPDAPTEEQASALLRCVARSANADEVGRNFSSAAIELALASYPGFNVTAPPGKGAPYGVFTAAHVEAELVPHTAVHHDGTRVEIEPWRANAKNPASAPDDAPAQSALDRAVDMMGGPSSRTPVSSGSVARPDEPAAGTRRVPLGSIIGARSGDKGGSANIGVWARSPEAWTWLSQTLTTEELRRLLPETANLTVHRYELPNLSALNFVIDGILGEGVASNARFDPQAKGLGEWLRSRFIDIPEALL